MQDPCYIRKPPKDEPKYEGIPGNIQKPVLTHDGCEVIEVVSHGEIEKIPVLGGCMLDTLEVEVTKKENDGY